MDYGTFQLKLSKRQYTIIGDPNLKMGKNMELIQLEPRYKAFVALSNSPITEYNAFDLYSEGKKIYLEFIALNENDEEEMLAFVNRYGFLHGENDEVIENKELAFNMAIDLINDVEDSVVDTNIVAIQKELILSLYNSKSKATFRENIDYFIYEIKIMRLLLQLKQAFDENDSKKMKIYCNQLIEICDKNLKNLKSNYADLDENNYDLFKISIGNLISDIINPYLVSANPIIIYDTPDNLYSSIKGWSCNSLLTAMYVMIYLDFTQGQKLRKCENITCNEWFPIYANDERKKYCSTLCAQAQASRAYRQRKKEGKV